MRPVKPMAIQALVVVLGCLSTTTVRAERQSHESRPDIAHRHHVSVFVGDTHLLVPGERNENGFTLGIDYEYRFSHRLGAGLVAEYAAGKLDATTLISALDVHLYEGLVLQLGVGAEFIDDRSNKLGRVGALYEFEFDEITVSPQIHYDVTNAEDSLVFGIAIGKNF